MHRLQVASLVLMPALAGAQERLAIDEPVEPPPPPRSITCYASGRPVLRLERARIKSRNTTSTWQLLQGVPWLQLADVPVSGVVVHSRRAFTSTPSPMRPCYTKVAIDGVVLSDPPMNCYRFLPTVHEIESFEVFTGPATIPSEFAGLTRDMQCGLVAIWTRQ